MTTLNDVKKVAASFGGSIEITKGSPTAIEALAPDGNKWSENGCQTLSSWIYSEWKESRTEAYEDLINRMNCGIESLTEDDL